MKFTKVVDTEIRKAKFDDGTIYAIIGQVKELLEKEIIFPDNTDNTSGNEEKWLGIEKNGDVFREFNTLEDAKNYYRSI
jgi:hypothetical protein